MYVIVEFCKYIYIYKTFTLYDIERKSSPVLITISTFVVSDFDICLTLLLIISSLYLCFLCHNYIFMDLIIWIYISLYLVVMHSFHSIKYFSCTLSHVQYQSLWFMLKLNYLVLKLFTQKFCASTIFYC